MTRRKPSPRRAEPTAPSYYKGTNKISVRQPQLIAGVLALALAFDSSGAIRIGLLCAALHECGHIAVYRLLAGEWPTLVLAPGEVRMRMPYDQFPPRKEMLVAAAGVVVNLLGCLAALLLMEYCIEYSYAGYWFAADNILLAGLNLLPLRMLDGGRMLICIRRMRGT